MIFNDRDLPWTVGLGIGSTTLLALFSGGILIIVLGLYLAYWVYTRRGQSIALWCYLLLAAVMVLALIPKMFPGYLPEVLAAVGLLLFFVAPLYLRSEIIRLYKLSHGVDLEINTLLTFLFSSIYLNYRLLDLPVPRVDSSEALTNAR